VSDHVQGRKYISDFNPDSLEVIGRALVEAAHKMREGRATILSGGLMACPDSERSTLTVTGDLVIEFHPRKN
jgi:hypothetical protein